MNNGERDRGIINIELDSMINIKNSRFHGCSSECKNYNMYVNAGTYINIENTEFKNAAGGIYIYNVHTCNIHNSIFRDHDMELLETTKYKEYVMKPGAMYGGAIYVSNVRNFNVENTIFKNNAVNEQGGATYMSLYFENPKATFKNVTFDNNFSFNEGHDLL
ncbi:hypothetical protein PIROE2DRAFT_7746, partial [Piromyces sp. E2]